MNEAPGLQSDWFLHVLENGIALSAVGAALIVASCLVDQEIQFAAIGGAFMVCAFIQAIVTRLPLMIVDMQDAKTRTPGTCACGDSECDGSGSQRS